MNFQCEVVSINKCPLSSTTRWTMEAQGYALLGPDQALGKLNNYLLSTAWFVYF